MISRYTIVEEKFGSLPVETGRLYLNWLLILFVKYLLIVL